MFATGRELEKQDTYPTPGSSWSRFFRNQEKLLDTNVHKELKEAVMGADALVLAVRHQEYLAVFAQP